MADIAMLVAEEYERRVKNARKIGAESEEIGLFSTISYLAQMVQEQSFHIRKYFGDDKIELIKWVNEPKTSITIAAISGFFSA